MPEGEYQGSLKLVLADLIRMVAGHAGAVFLQNRQGARIGKVFSSLTARGGGLRRAQLYKGYRQTSTKSVRQNSLSESNK